MSVTIFRQTMWIALVASVVVTIVALNAVPFARKGYLVCVEVEASKARLKMLHARVHKNPRSAVEHAQDNAAVVLAVRPVARTETDELTQEPNYSAQIICFSPVQPDAEELSGKLVAESKILSPAFANTDLERERRWIQWNLEATTHSLAQMDFERQIEADKRIALNPGLQTPQSWEIEARDLVGGVTSLDETILRRPVYQRATSTVEHLSDTPNDSNAVQDEDTTVAAQSDERRIPATPFSLTGFGSSDLETSLRQSVEANITALKNQLKTLEDQSQDLDQRLQGLMLVSDKIDVRVLYRSLTPGQLFGMIVLGVSVWIGSAYFYLQLVLGNSRQPKQIAAWLERKGIPSLGNLGAISSIAWNSPRQGKQKTQFQLHRVADVLLALLVIVIVSRVLVDPTWRHLLVSEPLTALGHLVRT